ncbi:Presenilin-2 [Physocladia obscura]|uniref:Presenilin n=1 Tax=Physocladia obscura TaxID=109957 RepID=A0AAD5T1R2_9FUNG|nr:Presenilin-2 [Physocladia obscura]
MRYRKILLKVCQECQVRHWPKHQSICSKQQPPELQKQPQSSEPQPSEQQRSEQQRPGRRRKRGVRSPLIFLGELDSETIAELRFYLVQIYSIVKPVVMCITLSILWMRLVNSPTSYFDKGLSSSIVPNIYAGGVSGVVSGGTAGGGSSSVVQTGDVTSALSIIGEIVGATIVIYLLFKYNCMKILYGFFGLIVLGLLGLFGYILATSLLSTYRVPLDYITFIFFLWNLAGVGMVSIFWKGPLLLQQWYMALSLSSLPAITSWILLSLLAVWDLIAVLCPCGPLRLLIEYSQQNNREIPALLYSAGPTMLMASPPSFQQGKNCSIEENTDFLQAIGTEREESILTTDPLLDSSLALNPAKNQSHNIYGVAASECCIDSATVAIGNLGNDMPGSQQIRVAVAQQQQLNTEGDGDDGSSSGMKLGLALLDWVSTMTVVVAVITGLNVTIFLLVLFQKALPALPISIAFGLLFYFSSFLALVPLVNVLTNIPDRLNMTTATSGSALWAGQNGGAGLIFL